MVCAIGCVAAIMAVVAWFHPGATPWRAALQHALRVPPTFGWLFALFLLVLRWRLPRAASQLVQRLAPVTLGIYLLHPFWIDLIDDLGWGLKQPGAWWFGYALLVYGLSAMTALLMAQLPGLRHLVR